VLKSNNHFQNPGRLRPASARTSEMPIGLRIPHNGKKKKEFRKNCQRGFGEGQIPRALPVFQGFSLAIHTAQPEVQQEAVKKPSEKIVPQTLRLEGSRPQPCRFP